MSSTVLNKADSGSGTKQPSVLQCLDKLCTIHLRKNLTRQATYSKPIVPLTDHLKPLKRGAYDALFNKCFGKKELHVTFVENLLSSEGWNEETVVAAVTYKMRTTRRRFHDADRLEGLTDKLLNVKDGDHRSTLRFLLCLADLTKAPEKHCDITKRRTVPTRDEIKKMGRRRDSLYFGDYPYDLYQASYTLYPPWYLSKINLDQPLMYPEKNKNAVQDLLYAKPYSSPKSSALKNSKSLYGLNSEFFSDKGLTDSTYEFDSQTRLYGGLRHSRTFDLDVRLSYPKITGPIDMMASISTSMASLDEGFVSRASSPDFSESEQSDNIQSNQQNEITSRLIPYHGYRFPDYDLNVWNDCLKIKKSKHRTWETLGLPAGSTKRKVYLTEAGAQIFDQVWQHRAMVVHKLSSFYSNTALEPVQWIELKQVKLVKHATLVLMGVASDSFQFNSLAEMFVPCKNLYFAGVDSDALHSLLSRFSDWGTCYWRLLHFSALSFSTPQNLTHFFNTTTNTIDTDDVKGVIFKAFADAVRRYLHEYQHQILTMKLENLTLQKLSVRLRKAGAQIRYVCQLCQCGSPDLPPPSPDVAKDFPIGVELLSYLYEEAVNCPEPNHYLALLYLLRKSCLPYLQFVQDWVFRGQCWDVRGEFMLKVNADFGGARKDRQRWLKYVEPIDPNDPGSCVPSFLSSVADEIHTCGKTVSLMQFLSPEHLLVLDGVDSPDLEITFSKRKLKVVENDWKRHDIRLINLERERTTHWIEKEEELKSSAHKRALMVRKSAKEEIIKMRESIAKEKEERNKLKRKEFERLKRQAEDDAERRAQDIQNERNEDLKREEARLKKEAIKQAEENRILQEETAKVISYYEELNIEAERRIRKAAWSSKRNRLRTERLKYMMNEKTFWQKQLQITDISDTAENILAEDIQSNIVENKSLSSHAAPFNENCIPEPDLLQEFLDTTFSSQNDDMNVIQSPRQPSDTEKALQAIGDRGPISGVVIPTDSSFRPQIASGSHHVSEESSSPNFETRMRKTITGKNITDTHFKFGDDQPLENSVTSSRLVGNKRVSDSCIGEVFYEDSARPVTNSTARLVEGKSIADSNIGDLMGVMSMTPPSEVQNKQGRKLIPGHGITVTSFDDNSKTINVPHIRLLKERQVSDSAMGQIMEDGTPSDSAPKLFKKMVSGQRVSNSTMGDLLSYSTDQSASTVTTNLRSHDSVVGEIICGSPSLNLDHQIDTTDAQNRRHATPNPSDSTVETVLNKNVLVQREFFKKKKLDGKNVSESCVDLMKLKTSSEQGILSNQEIDRLRRFEWRNKVHGSHHSHSSIQGLMYYDDSISMDLKKEENFLTKNTSAVRNLKPSVNSSKRHPSYSTLQLLMYPVSEDMSAMDEIEPEEKTFHLQLPSITNYSDVLKTKIKMTKDSNKSVEMTPVDLIGNITRKNAENMYEDRAIIDDDYFDWRSDIDAVDVHALPVLLSQCVLRPIMQQIALANRCVLNYFMVDMELPRHFEMLRHFCFMEDGEFSQVLTVQLFEKMRSGCRPIDLLNPVVLGSLITQAVQGSAQRNSKHSKKLTFCVQHLPVAFGTSDPSSLDCFTLKYDVGWPCNIVITESNQQKYGQVFGFLLKLKHVMWTLHDVVTKLSAMEMSDAMSLTDSEIRRLHLYRHEMQNFIKVMQGYVSTQVVHVCWFEFQDSLRTAKCLEDLHTLHVEYLRKCVYRCLLTKKTSAVMNIIIDVFKTILRFWTQLSSKSVSFSKLKHTYDNFQKFSMFLFKVVSKLVDRGYQPHLEDFLVRLNFNGFYKE